MQHHASLDQQLLELTLAMAEVNQMAIDVNSRVIETNESIVAFNAKYIQENSAWLANGGMLSSRRHFSETHDLKRFPFLSNANSSKWISETLN